MSGGKRSYSSYTRHNRVEIVHGGSEYFERMVEMIDSAGHLVHLHVYIFDDDETGTSVGEALIRAAGRGVQVYVLVDGYASRGLSSSFRGKLSDSGVHFCYFEPFFRSRNFYIGRRLHHKVLVVDAYKAMVGGINISNRYNDIQGRVAWLDWAAYAEGDIAFQLNEFCLELWDSAYARSLAPLPEFSVPSITDECAVRMRRNDWVERKTGIYRSYMELFSTAKEQVTLMSGYFWPGRKLLRKIIAAASRGVRIRIMLAGVSDVPIAKSAERYVYRRLFRNNIEIYEYQDNVLHGKIAVADRVFVTVGSYNVNNISAHASLELNLDIKDERFAATVERELDLILRTKCIQITEDYFNKKYNGWQRLWQRIAFDIVHIIFFLFTFYFRQKAARKMSRSLAE